MEAALPTPEDKALLQPEQDSPEVQNERVRTLCYDLVEKAEKEDETFRYRMLQFCKRNELYFNNIQRIFFDEVARDYRTIDQAMHELEKVAGVDDIKTINIYRAYAESLISALSVSTPNIGFAPDDAENDYDIQTASAYDRIVKIVSKHCPTELLFIKSLMTHYNQGTIFAYNYYKEDPAYGVITKPKVANKKIPAANTYCPQCYNPIDKEIPADHVTPAIQCQDCGYQGPPEVEKFLTNITEVIGYEDTPKGRVGFDIFGPTHVKAPLYARKQEDLGYLILRLEDNVAKFKKVYETDDIQPGGGDTYRFERWARMPIEYFGTIPVDITTARYAFIRPWYYYNLSFDDAKFLEEQFPTGIKITIIGDDVLEVEECSLDKYWTVTFNPLSNFIHGEPPGNITVPIQDSENDLFNLGLLSIEYGIPETFVNPKTVNLSKYQEGQSSPGMMTPALPPGPDKNLSDGFHTIKAATLSNEYTNFEKGAQELGQFVSGAIPSIWGGTNSAGSNTATEYTESRARALQRLQLTWKMVSDFWAKLMFRCATQFADNMKEDAQFADKSNGSYVNVWIRKSELLGKIGRVELEYNEQLPQSWMQIRDSIMKLLEMQDPMIGQVLMHPNNSEILKRVIAIPEFYIPGEHDRNKQWSEFYVLSQQEPMGNRPSLEPDLDVDDHAVEMQVLKNILVSPVGLQLYQTNPSGYTNCVLHYKAHEIALQAKTASMAGGKPAGEKPDSATQTTQG